MAGEVLERGMAFHKIGRPETAEGHDSWVTKRASIRSTTLSNEMQVAPRWSVIGVVGLGDYACTNALSCEAVTVELCMHSVRTGEPGSCSWGAVHSNPVHF